MKNLTRRKFIARTSAVAAGALIVPITVRSGIGTGSKANDKINIAVIGAGGQGMENLRDCTGENVVAICDVSETAAAGAFKQFPDAKRFKDFRVMFDKMA